MKLSFAAPRWTEQSGPKVLGVIMIVRDEADNLPAVFRSLAAVADEVVVVDTGSTDATPVVCEAWGVTLVRSGWRDDFAEARNRSIEAATARHLLWLDGDDRLSDATVRGLIELRDRLLSQTDGQAFTMQIQNSDRNGAVIDTFKQVRIFPRHRKIRFQGAIHESVSEALRELRVPLVTTELVIEHTGYADLETVAVKAKRNEALLRNALKRDPKSVNLLLHLAQTQMGTGRPREADSTISEALRYASSSSGSDQMIAEFHVLRASYRKAYGNVLGATYDHEQAIARWPQWGYPFACLAQIRAEQREWDEVLKLAGSARAGSFEPGIVGFRLVRHRSNVELLTAHALQQTGGDGELVLRHLREAMDIDPTFITARLDLGQALLERERYEEARAVLEPAGEDESALEWFVEISTAIGLARAMTGDEAGAVACLAPLLDLFAYELGGADDISPLELAEVLLKRGAGRAANNMITLFQKSLSEAA